MRKASDICRVAYDTIMEKYGKVYYRRDNNPISYSWEYNVGKFHDGVWSFDCLGFVHAISNDPGFCNDRSSLGGGSALNDFLLASDESTTLTKYCSVRGGFPKADIKPASLLKQSGHVGLYIGEHYVPEIRQTINTAEVCMSMGGGGKFSWVDTTNGNRYTCKGGQYLSTWTNWGQFDRVEYDGGMTTDEAKDPTPATPTPTELYAGDLGIDLSYHQGEANWFKLRNAGVKFAIIREGWGEDCDGKGVDPGFHKYVKGAQEAGVKVMVYHFMYGTSAADAVENAKCAIKNVEEAGLGKDTVIWCDIEYDIVDDAKKDYRGNVTLTPAMQRVITDTFCDYILSKGYPTGVYTNRDYVTRVLGEDILKKYDIWLADLDGADDYPCVIRQYDWYSKYDGIGVNVDKNVFRGNYTVGTAKYKGGHTPTPVTPTPEPVQPSNPTTDKATLRKYTADAMQVVTKGVKGQTVECLQKMLKATGDYKGYIDGEAGYYTDQAIRSYQKRNGLTVDGSFGPASWLSMMTKYPGHFVNNITYVAYGSKGTVVKTLQTVLKKLGYYTDAIDGNAGPLTVKAIKAYQKAYGLAVDGSFGPLSWSKLISM